MKKIKLLSFLMVLLFSVPASAEFYRYTDKNGKVRYTDDYSKVPKTQRSSTSEYRGFENEYTGEATDVETNTEIDPDTKNLSEPTQEAEEGQESNVTSDEVLDATKRRLDQKQQEINKDLDDLNKEQSELDNLKEMLKTKSETREYNSKVEAFNEKVKQFKEKQKALIAEAEAYNKDAEKSIKNSLNQYNKAK